MALAEPSTNINAHVFQVRATANGQMSVEIIWTNYLPRQTYEQKHTVCWKVIEQLDST